MEQSFTGRPCWWPLAHLDYEESIIVLKGVTCTISFNIQICKKINKQYHKFYEAHKRYALVDMNTWNVTEKEHKKTQISKEHVRHDKLTTQYLTSTSCYLVSEASPVQSTDRLLSNSARCSSVNKEYLFVSSWSRYCRQSQLHSICRGTWYSPVIINQLLGSTRHPGLLTALCEGIKTDVVTTTNTILQPLYRTTDISQHPHLRTEGYCQNKVLLPACSCWWQPAHPH